MFLFAERNKKKLQNPRILTAFPLLLCPFSPLDSIVCLYRHQRLQNVFVLKPNNMEDVKVRETHINVVRFSTVELFADTFMFFILFVRNCVWKKIITDG